MEGSTAFTREYIETRIMDWEARINHLFDNVLEWMSEKPEWRPERLKVMSGREYLMRQYEVSPRELPTLALYKGSSSLRFVPSALWVVGANGRINITSNTKLYILVDIGGKHDEESKWRLADPQIRLEHKAFDKETFFEILDENQ